MNVYVLLPRPGSSVGGALAVFSTMDIARACIDKGDLFAGGNIEIAREEPRGGQLDFALSRELLTDRFTSHWRITKAAVDGFAGATE